MLKIFFTSFLVLLLTLPLFAQTHTAWVRTYGSFMAESNDIFVDSSGSVYITGADFGDCVTIKYHPNGDTAWIRSYSGPSNALDYGRALGVDSYGNVFVTGSTAYLDDKNYLTIKYDSSGNVLWVREYNGPGNSEDEARALAVDIHGNVYVTGFSSGSGTSYDYATIKYCPNGDTAWVRRYNGIANGWDWVKDIKVDKHSNVYVTGNAYFNETSWDYTTIKYDSSGNQLWMNSYNGPANTGDQASEIALDDLGNVYVTGISPGSGSDNDWATAKYDSNGHQLWVKRYDGPTAYSDDRAHAISVDKTGNVYVAGTSGYWPNLDYLIIRYDSDGNEIWEASYDGPANSYEEAYDIAIDRHGNVYVTGSSAQYIGDPWSFDYATVMYDQHGNEVCAKRYDSGGADIASTVYVDDSGKVYITGFNGYALITIKYLPIGLAGDTNGDNKVTVLDIFYLIDYLYRGAPAQNPLGSSDVNDDGSINLKDVVYLLNYLFRSGPFPVC